MKTKLLNILILATFLGITGCEAPAGEVGPQGAAGATGEKGEKGPTGDKGAFSGYASEWTNIANTQWKLTGLKAVNTQTDARLTQAILDQGLVLAYYKRNLSFFFDTNAVYQIPDDWDEYLFTFKANVGSMDYEIYFKSAQAFTPELYEWQIAVRYIVVPTAKAGRMKNIDWSNYNEVKRILNLND